MLSLLRMHPPFFIPAVHDPISNAHLHHTLCPSFTLHPYSVKVLSLFDRVGVAAPCDWMNTKLLLAHPSPRNMLDNNIYIQIRLCRKTCNFLSLNEITELGTPLPNNGVENYPTTKFGRLSWPGSPPHCGRRVEFRLRIFSPFPLRTQ